MTLFYKSKSFESKYSIENRVHNIERSEQATSVRVILNSDLQWSPHIKHILSQITQHFCLLGQLKNMAMEKSMLDQVFQSLIITRICNVIEVISCNMN